MFPQNASIPSFQRLAGRETCFFLFLLLEGSKRVSGSPAVSSGVGDIKCRFDELPGDGGADWCVGGVIWSVLYRRAPAAGPALGSLVAGWVQAMDFFPSLLPKH